VLVACAVYIGVFMKIDGARLFLFTRSVYHGNAV
jgi:hypothetical protein